MLTIVVYGTMFIITALHPQNLIRIIEKLK